LDEPVGIRIEQDDLTVKDLQVEATPEQAMPPAIALRVRLGDGVAPRGRFARRHPDGRLVGWLGLAFAAAAGRYLISRVCGLIRRVEGEGSASSEKRLSRIAVSLSSIVSSHDLDRKVCKLSGIML